MGWAGGGGESSQCVDVLFLVCIGAAITVLVLAASEISVTLNNGSIYWGLIA